MENQISQEKTQYKTIRDNILCGKCTASMFMFWDLKKDDRYIQPLEDEALLPMNIVKDKQTGISYIVRCDYLKSAIFAPDKIKHCEAFKKIEEDKSNNITT